MPFGNPIVGNKKLIRSAIESENYVPGTSGWSIQRNGFAEFLDVVIRGNLRSNNYVPGVSGWNLDQNGAAEFSQILINSFGAAGKVTISGGKLQIFNSTNQLVISAGVDAASPYFGPYFALHNPATGDPHILMNTPTGLPLIHIGIPGGGFIELDPGVGFGASVRVQPVVSGASVISPGVIQGAETLPDMPALELYSPVNTTDAPVAQSVIQLEGGNNANVYSKIVYTADRHEFSGTFLANRMRTVEAEQLNTISTGSLTYVATGGGGTVLETTLNFLPQSGAVRVDIMARVTNTLAATASLMSYEIRENTVVGAVIMAANDSHIVEVDASGSSLANSNIVTGLPVISATVTALYFRGLYRVNAGTGTFANRRMLVTPLP